MQERSDLYPSANNPPPAATSKCVIDEERETIARQYEMMQHIDDRALRITRTSAVLLGITFTGISILVDYNSENTALVVPDIPLLATISSSFGVLFLTISLIIGIVTTQYSRPIYGIGERPRHSISARQNERKALSELSDEYDDVISVMQSRLERNRRLLWSVQIIFIFGLFGLIAGSALVLSKSISASTVANSTEVALIISTITFI